ncbi:hypothetical protein D3C78_1288650 [compost metagenome]
MVLFRPGATDPTMQHRADRALDPDPGVDVHNDAQHQHESGQRVQQSRQADRTDTEVLAEPGPPDHDATEQQHQHAQQQGPEQQLLPGVVLADRWHALLFVAHHPVDTPEPQTIIGDKEIRPPEAQYQKEKEYEHQHTDKRVQDARPRPATEQMAEPEQRRVKQRQPRQRGHDEQDRHQPVVAALVGVVAQDGFVFHGRSSPCPPGLCGSYTCTAGSTTCTLVSAALGCSSSSTRFGPTRT